MVIEGDQLRREIGFLFWIGVCTLSSILWGEQNGSTGHLCTHLCTHHLCTHQPGQLCFLFLEHFSLFLSPWLRVTGNGFWFFFWVASSGFKEDLLPCSSVPLVLFLICRCSWIGRPDYPRLLLRICGGTASFKLERSRLPLFWRLWCFCRTSFLLAGVLPHISSTLYTFGIRKSGGLLFGWIRLCFNFCLEFLCFWLLVDSSVSRILSRVAISLWIFTRFLCRIGWNQVICVFVLILYILVKSHKSLSSDWSKVRVAFRLQILYRLVKF